MHIKHINSIFYFYRSFSLPGIVFSVVCCWLFWKYGVSMLPVLVLFKLVTDFITGYFINQAKRRQFFYYYNQHISRGYLWSIAFLIDLLIFLVVLCTVLVLR